MIKNPININYQRVEDLKRLDFIKLNINKFEKNKLSVLDVGCGNGIISRFIASLGHKVLGIDISKATIEKAKYLNTLSNLDFQNISAEELLVSQKYDVIICSEVIEHLYKPTVVLETLKKLLHKDGILIVTVPNGFGPRELFMTRPLQWIKNKAPEMYNILNKFKKKF
jgi:ubiquinone biosynthesis O-methyltransferase